LGKSEEMKCAYKMNINRPTPKSIQDIIDCNFKKVTNFNGFNGNIFDTIGHQKTALVSISPNVCFSTTWKKTEQAKYALK